MDEIKVQLQEGWQEYIQGFAPWKLFLTLTFSQADRFYPVTQDQVVYDWRKLVRVLNKDLWGNNYTSKVHHSYFSYILAIEPHRSGALHAHALVDQPINPDLLEVYWNKIAGWEKIKTVAGDREKMSKYLSKYIIKGGMLYPYKSKSERVPTFQPYWWSS